MKIPPKIIFILLSIAAGFIIARYFAQDRFPTVLFATVLICGIADSLWEKRTSIGLRQVGIEIQRSQSPFAYWTVLLIYTALIAAAIFSLFFKTTDDAIKALLSKWQT